MSLQGTAYRLRTFALAMLVVAAMLLTSPAAAFAQDEDLGPLDYSDGADEAQVALYDLVSDQTSELIGAMGDEDATWYVVQGHVAMRHGLSVSGKVKLLLCDDANLEMVKESMVVEPGSTLDVYTQQGGSGMVSGTSCERIIEVRGNATLNLHDGNFIGMDGSAIIYCGGVQEPAINAHVNQYGGTISFGETGVYLDGGSFAMHDGCISDNASAGVCATNGASCTIDEGVVYDNIGFGLLNQGAHSFEIHGGCVGSNKMGLVNGDPDSESAGEPFAIDGAPAIVGNTDADIYLRNGQIIKTGKLAGTARIGVKLEGRTGSFTEGYRANNAKLEPEKVFISDEGLTLTCDNGSEVHLLDTEAEKGESAQPEGDDQPGIEVTAAPKAEGDKKDAGDDASGIEVKDAQTPADAKDAQDTKKVSGTDKKSAGKTQAKRKTSSLKPEFVGSRVKLSGEIGVISRVKLPVIEGVNWETCSMTFAVGGSQSREVTVPYADADISDTPTGLRVASFVCPLSSIELADRIQMTLHYQQGGKDRQIERSTSWEYAYGNGSNEGGAASSKLAAALNDFGFYAQRFLANRRGWKLGREHVPMERCVITPDQMDVDAVRDELEDLRLPKHLNGCALECVTMDLRLGATMAADIWLYAPEGVSVDAEAEFAGRSFDLERVDDGRYRFHIDGMRADQLDETIKLRGTAEGDFFVHVQPLYYVKSVLDSRPFGVRGDIPMASLYNYYRAAEGGNTH